MFKDSGTPLRKRVINNHVSELWLCKQECWVPGLGEDGDRWWLSVKSVTIFRIKGVKKCWRLRQEEKLQNPKIWAQIQIPLQVVGARGLPDLPKAPFPEWKTGEMRTADPTGHLQRVKKWMYIKHLLEPAGSARYTWATSSLSHHTSEGKDRTTGS